jgi:hypothetical protein
MCFNKETSFFTWIVAFTIGVVLLIKGSFWKGLFLLTFSVIQLLEAIVWLSIENGDNSLNSNTTKIILLALWLQPIVNVLCAIRFGMCSAQTPLGESLRCAAKQLFIYLLGALILTFVYSLYRVFSDEKFKTHIGPTGHLIWTNNNNLFSSNPVTSNILGTLYIIGLCVPLIFMQHAFGPLLVMGVTVLWSFFNYWKTKEFSSMWCFSAASLSIVYSLSDSK